MRLAHYPLPDYDRTVWHATDPRPGCGDAVQTQLCPIGGAVEVQIRVGLTADEIGMAFDRLRAAALAHAATQPPMKRAA